MVESQMDHGIRLGRSAAQAFQVFEIAAVHLGAGASQRIGASLGASQPQNLMTCANELRDQSRTYKSCCTRNENTHRNTPVPEFGL
jgi:hypothetical protein